MSLLFVIVVIAARTNEVYVRSTVVTAFIFLSGARAHDVGSTGGGGKKEMRRPPPNNDRMKKRETNSSSLF